MHNILSDDNKPTIGLLYFGGDAGDLADTIEAVKGIEKALVDNNYKLIKIEVNESNWKEAVLVDADVIFNLVEDPGFVLYRKVGNMLEKLGKAQVGHDKKCFGYINNKSYFKSEMMKSGIATPKAAIIKNIRSIKKAEGLKFPVIIKPISEHAGIGISQCSVVENKKDLMSRTKKLIEAHPGGVVVEEYIDGREMHVTVIGNGKQVMALPVSEIVFGGEFEKNWKIYTYDAKWEKDSWEYWSARVESPAHITAELEKKIKKLAVKTYKKFTCRDIARMDIRVDKMNRAYVVDININPSLNRFDDQDATTKSLEAASISYETFINKLVELAYMRVYKNKISSRQNISINI